MKLVQALLCVALSAGPAWASSAWAASAGAAPEKTVDYPTRAVRLVVPYAAGGGVDLLGRKFAEALSRSLGQSVFVENKVGAGGTLGAVSVSQARPDGYTLLFGGAPLITNKLLNPSLTVDAISSFAPVSLINTNPFVLTVSAQSPYQGVMDIVEAARKQPGVLNFASGGIGTGSHLAGAALATDAKIDVVHVPYRGSVELIPSLISGQTQFCFPVVTAALPQMESGAIKILAVTSSKRLDALPDVPTLQEVVKSDDVVVESWNGVWAPLGVEPAIVARLNTAIRQAFEDEELRKFFSAAGAPVALTRDADDFAAFLVKENEKFKRIVSAARLGQY